MKRPVQVVGAAATLVVLWLFLSAPAGSIEYVRPFLPGPDPQATVIFGGDMLFDRTIRIAMAEKGEDHIFSCIRDVLASPDLVVANLEGPITSHPSKSVGTKPGAEGNFTFTFPTSTALMLARHNIRLVSIGNNHIMNFGRDGLRETKYWLDAASVGYFGDPDLSESERVERMQLQGIPVSFVNWSDWTSDKTDHTVAQVRQEHEAGRIVLVYAHWGEEYEAPPERVKQLARAFVDAGADLVVGSHPHIVQEAELFGETHVYYSLGNFVFDQYWSEEVRRGLLLEITFDKKGVTTVREIPIDNQTDRRTCVA